MLNNIITDEQQEQLEKLIRESETNVCVCDQNPDGDALGSCLAWAEVLRTMFQ